MKDILVFLSPSLCRDNLSRGGHYAIALARRSGAHLSALIADIETDVHELPPEPDIRRVEKAATKPKLSTERAARVAELLRPAAVDAGISCDILQTESQSV